MINIDLEEELKVFEDVTRDNRGNIVSRVYSEEQVSVIQDKLRAYKHLLKTLKNLGLDNHLEHKVRSMKNANEEYKELIEWLLEKVPFKLEEEEWGNELFKGISCYNKDTEEYEDYLSLGYHSYALVDKYCEENE